MVEPEDQEEHYEPVPKNEPVVVPKEGEEGVL